MGFGHDSKKRKKETENLMSYVMPQDLKSFGLIPEIIGRLPVLTSLEPLDREALRRILTEPKNAIVRQYKRLFELDNVTLVFADDALDLIVDKAIEYKLGARGLRSIVETVMVDAMFDVPSSGVSDFTVTRDYVAEKLREAHFEKPISRHNDCFYKLPTGRRHLPTRKMAPAFFIHILPYGNFCLTL